MRRKQAVYCGRIVVVGYAAQPFVAYRISSRSFPNRDITVQDGVGSVVPRQGFEADLQKNPFISYRCLRVLGESVVMSNGSHTDPISVKAERGMPLKDAMVMGLLAYDYEGDAYNTPRIAGGLQSGEGHLGIVTKDTLEVARFSLKPGFCRVIATNELNRLSSEEYAVTAASASELVSYVLRGGVFGQMTHPVAAVACMGGAVAVENVGG
jgi:IMP cyclohydrolase